jgi:hypothetical protein
MSKIASYEVVPTLQILLIVVLATCSWARLLCPAQLGKPLPVTGSMCRPPDVAEPRGRCRTKGAPFEGGGSQPRDPHHLWCGGVNPLGGEEAEVTKARLMERFLSRLSVALHRPTADGGVFGAGAAV